MYVCVCICVCMNVCMYMCMCVCVYVYMCVHVCMCVLVCMCMCVFMCVYMGVCVYCVYVSICMYVCIYMYICFCMYVCGGCMCACVCVMRVCICMHACMCVFVRVYVHVCVCVGRQRGRWSWAQGNTIFKGHPRDVPIGSSGAAAACICLEIQPRDVYNFPQITPWREKWQSVSDTKNTRKQGDTDSHLLYSGYIVPKPTSWKPLCSRRITSWVVPFSSSRGHMLDGPTRTCQWAWKTLPITLSNLRNSRVSGACCVTSCFYTHHTVSSSSGLGGMVPTGSLHSLTLSSTSPSKFMNSSSHAQIPPVSSSPWPCQGGQEPKAMSRASA